MSVRCAMAVLMMWMSAVPALADATAPVLAIRGKQFEPNQLVLPAGVKLKLVLRNLDDLPMEFESYDLSREVMVPGHGEVAIYIGPLQAGSYRFFNDFDHDVQGTVVVPAQGN